MRFRASDVAAALGASLVGPDVPLDGASYDSRALTPGQLFVPIVAERDGHDFVDAAVAAGAGAYLSSRGRLTDAVPVIEVPDTAAALLQLGAWGVRRLAVPVVAITGSVGKTSVKDLTAAALATERRVTASPRSFNNEQGLPITVLGAADDTDVLVLEMGMRGPGEIARLCEVAPPGVGVVTAVAAAHSGRLGGIEGVARAKSELVAALPADGVAVLNADDGRVAAMARLAAGRVITFGESPDADVRVTITALDELARPTVEFTTPWGPAGVRLAASGRHMAVNAGAAIAVAGVLGVPVDGAAAALGIAELSGSRMTVHVLPGGGVLVDDAYNANPTSMRASLEALAAIPATRRVAVLGIMAELDDPDAAHREVAGLAQQLGIELIAVGTDGYGVPPVADPIAAVGPIGAGTAVTVKASLVGGLQKVAAALLDANS